MNTFEVTLLLPLSLWQFYLGTTIVCGFFMAFFSPRLGDPATIVEEPPDIDHIVPQHLLCHSDLVATMSGAKSFHHLMVSLWNVPSWEMMRGTITALTTLFSIVSFVAHTLYLSPFS